MARRANSLTTLVNQINKRFPNRDKTSDGWIGDASHSSRVSDHNPNQWGVVCAIDIDEDVAPGMDLQWLLRKLLQTKDYRINYIIYEGYIYGRTGFAKRVYKGVNAHKHHMHISVRQDPSIFDDAQLWDIFDDAPKPTPATANIITPKSQEDDDVAKAIQFESVGADGKKHIYVAFPNAREYDYADSLSEIGDYKNILTQQGFEYLVWKNRSGNSLVDNPDVFGKYVGPAAVKPAKAKRED